MKARALKLTAIAHGLRSLWNAALYPRVSFDFLSGALDPRVTFSRGSNATLIGSDGTLQYAPHNLLTYSEQFDNAVWAVTAATISANAVSAPNGTQTADQLVETVGTGTLPRLPIPITLNVGQTYSASVYAKEVPGSSKRYLQVYFNAGFASVPCGANFNLATGTVTYSSGLASTSVENVGDGWWRCTINTTAVLVAATGFRIALVDNPTQVMSLAWNPDGTGSMYLWGAQLNVGALQPYYSTTVKNLLGYSQEFDNAAWTKSNSTITADVTAAPDGSVTADKLVEDTVNAAHFVQSANLTAQSGTAYTFSCYAKAAGRSKFELLAFALTLTGRGFDLSNGTTFTNTAGLSEPTASSITPVGNGWYRCSVTANGNGLLSSVRAYLNNGTTYAYTGDGTSGIFIWGAQFSDSATLDPYVYNPAAAPSNAAYYGPRRDYDPVTLAAKGLLIEEQRTNSIRNNTMQGAVAGTPGTLPTNWFFGGNAALSREIVGVGVENGINYLDIRMFGTTAAVGTPEMSIGFESTTFAAAATSQTWTAANYIKVVGGSLNGVANGEVFLIGNDNTPALTEASSTSFSYAGLTGPLPTHRFLHTRTLSVATTASIYSRIDINFTGGGGSVVDITLRIGLPQLELGAFATSAIPTTTAAATRAADVLSITGANFSNWYNPVEGTTLVEASTLPNVTTAALTYAISDGTFNNSLYGNFAAGNSYRGANVPVAGVGQVDSIGTFSIASSSNNTKDAFAYKLNDFGESCNGVTTRTDNLGVLPVVNRLYIGSSWSGNSNYLNGHIRSFKYYPTRLSNSQLQSLTVLPLLWTPAQIPTALWLDAADANTITLNGSTVSQWNDKSGNGRNATQVTAANQPTYNPTGFSGKPSLVFDGVNDDLRSTAPDGNTFAVYWVGFGSTNVTTPGQPWFNAPFFSKVFRVGGLFKSGASGQFQVGDYDGADKSVVVPYVFSTPAIFEASKGSGLLTARLNGDVSNTTSIGNSGGFPGIKLGTNYNDTIFLQHTVGEYVYCSEPLSTTDRQKLEGYLAWKWGLQANLPVGHPYKAAAPTV